VLCDRVWFFLPNVISVFGFFVKVISGDANAPSQETLCSATEYNFRQNSGEGTFSEMERDPATKDVMWPLLVMCRYQVFMMNMSKETYRYDYTPMGMRRDLVTKDVAWPLLVMCRYQVFMMNMSKETYRYDYTPMGMRRDLVTKDVAWPLLVMCRYQVLMMNMSKETYRYDYTPMGMRLDLVTKDVMWPLLVMRRYQVHIRLCCVSTSYGVALVSRIDKIIEVSFAKEAYKRDNILQKRPII